MSRFWSAAALRTEPYVPGDQPTGQIIKLNTNENPYPPSPRVMEALQEAITADLRLYPNPDADKVRAAAAELYQLSTEQVFVGNGSDEVLAFAFMAFFHQDRPIRFPDITYSFYPVYAQLYQIPVEEVPLREDFSINPEDYFNSQGGVIFPNPNAPTGLIMPLKAIEEILNHNQDRVVIVDEAYIDFGGESAALLVNKYPNLLVIQTLSKSRSLAGLRIGLAFGSHELIAGLERIKGSINSYTMDRLAQTAAVAALKDQGYFRETCERIISTREKAMQQLKDLGFSGPESMTNFVFVTHEKVPAAQIYEELKQAGIFVRYFAKPRIDNYLRITIGTPAEMDRLIEQLDRIVKR